MLGWRVRDFRPVSSDRRNASGQGQLLDAAGWGPVEMPHRIVLIRPGLRLRAYGGPVGGSPLLIVPAPIKRAYIWDLHPRVSAVRRCLEGGLRVYLAEWTIPGPERRDMGLADYADGHILAALDAVAAETGEGTAFLAGHSLGGTLAAIGVALHPDRVRGLVLLESPLHFGADAGDLAPLVAASPNAGAIPGASGLVPGSALTAAGVAASPGSFIWSVWRDRAASMIDPEALRTYAAVMRWTLDEVPMPGRLFAEVVDDLYREDRFFRGALTAAGRRVGPQDLRCPILAAVNPKSTLIPPCSIVPFLVAAAHADASLLAYEGDCGVAVQHVGSLVGRSAHRTLWPDILRWVHGQKVEGTVSPIAIQD